MLREEAGISLGNVELNDEELMVLLKDPVKRDLNFKLTCFKWNPSLETCAFGSANGSLYLLNRIKVQSFKTHSSLILNLSWNEDGKYLATASQDCTVKIHTFVRNEIRTICTFVHGDLLSHLEFCKNRLMTACKDGKIYMWDVESEKVLKSFDHSEWVRSFDVSLEFNALVSGSGHVIFNATNFKFVYLWNLRNETFDKFIGHNHIVESVVFTNFEKDLSCFASGGRDKNVLLWRSDSKSPIKSFELNGWVKALRLSSNSLFSLSDDGKVILWDLENKVDIKTFSNDQVGFRIFYFDVSADRKLSFGSSGGQFLCDITVQ